MKSRFLVLVFAAALIGCAKNHSTTETALSVDTDAAPTHKEGQGLLLCDATEKSIGLETSAVAEKKLKAQFTIQFQIFKEAVANDTAKASGLIPHEQATNLKIGEHVVIDTAGENVKATIVKTNLLNGQIEVLVSIPDAGKKFKMGSALQATFVSDSEKTVLAIPSPALLQSAEGDFVYVQNGDHYLRTPVKVGEKFDGFVEILDGVYDGDVVVSRALQTLWLVELRAVKGGKGCCGNGSEKKKS